MKSSHRAILVVVALLAAPHAFAAAVECTDWQTAHPAWLFCDDFESDSALESNYFEVDRRGGQFGVVTGDAFGGNGAIRAHFKAGVAEAGGVKLSFGKTPVSPKRFTDQNFDDIYWRFYMKTSANWTGQPDKVTRATIFTASSWSQAAIGHLWEDGALGMGLDPATGVSGSTVVTTQYNDFAHLTFLGKKDGTTQVYSTDNRNKWKCIEIHMKLNTPGQSNGQFAFWVDGHLENQVNTLNWRGSYTTYGINAIMLENFKNTGAPQDQDRFMDNFVVSKEPIGCASGTATKIPSPPTEVRTN